MTALPLAHAGTSEHETSVLDAHGRGARIIGHEIAYQIIAGSAVFLLVTAIIVAIVVRQRRRPAGGEPLAEDEAGHGWIWGGGIVLPLVVITTVALASAISLSHLSQGAAPPGPSVTVTAHRWWWEVRYPGAGVISGNEVVLPAGRTAHLRLYTADVQHSFWIPGIERKIDMIPGHRTTLDVTPQDTGAYLGECQEFCGLEHARMRFRVRVLSPQAFATWVAASRAGARPPATAAARRGRAVFMATTCPACHTIAGTPARGQVGPDLTHVASRDRIAAGTIANTPANLAAWVSDPSRIKPGAMMPRATLGGPQLQALLAYLRQLR
jgi:cytochrome c oxidase subunit 2